MKNYDEELQLKGSFGGTSTRKLLGGVRYLASKVGGIISSKSFKEGSDNSVSVSFSTSGNSFVNRPLAGARPTNLITQMSEEIGFQGSKSPTTNMTIQEKQ